MKWYNRPLLRYILLNIPAAAFVVLVLLLLQKYAYISTWVVILVITIWVVKDIILYPFVRLAYAGGKGQAEDHMQGLEGLAQERLDPQGFVRVRGERWLARVEDKSEVIEAGAAVKVVGRKGLRLIVTTVQGGENR